MLDNYQNPFNKYVPNDKSYIKVNTNNESCIDNLDIYFKIEDNIIKVKTSWSFLLLPMHRKPSFCGGTDLSCVLFAGKKPKTPYFISSRNDL